jgi:hypothetical protein
MWERPSRSLTFVFVPYQHDPDDEPVAPPLDPEFFEFDCGCLFETIFQICIDFGCSTQGRYQSGAVKGAIVRGDYELQAGYLRVVHTV